MSVPDHNNFIFLLWYNLFVSTLNIKITITHHPDRLSHESFILINGLWYMHAKI